MTGRVFLLGRGPEFFARLTCGVEFRALTSLLLCQLLQDGNPLARTANCLKIILRIDPTALGRDGI